MSWSKMDSVCFCSFSRILFARLRNYPEVAVLSSHSCLWSWSWFRRVPKCLESLSLKILSKQWLSHWTSDPLTRDRRRDARAAKNWHQKLNHCHKLEVCLWKMKNWPHVWARSSAHPPFRAKVKLSFKYEVQRAHRGDREVEESLELEEPEFRVHQLHQSFVVHLPSNASTTVVKASPHIIACTFSQSLWGLW